MLFGVTVTMVGKNIFRNNSCKKEACHGGAMYLYLSKLNISHGIGYFHFNKAVYGGAIELQLTIAYFSGRVTMLKNKADITGGALVTFGGELSLDNKITLTLMENVAGKEGGAMYVFGIVTLHGNVIIENNKAEIGGGIRVYPSSIHIVSSCSFSRNNATYGGAMSTLYGTVYLEGHTQFTHNTANQGGGAIFIAGTEIQVLGHVEFSFNSAENGGAMFFDNGASLNFINQTGFHIPFLASSFNSARQDGGVIYHNDSPSISQCSHYAGEQLPYCFLLFQNISSKMPTIVSKNDSAEREGNFMFGGLMDRCKIDDLHIRKSIFNGGAISICDTLTLCTHTICGYFMHSYYLWLFS